MDLGELGIERDPHDATFGYFGATVRVHPDLSDVAVLALFSETTAIIAEADPDPAKVLASMRGVAAVLVHPDDVEEFWRRARDNRQSMEDIADLAMRLLGALTDRPTRRPSDSSDGPSSTATTSAAGSSSPALRLLEHRPDLAVAVLRSEEARSA